VRALRAALVRQSFADAAHHVEVERGREPGTAREARRRYAVEEASAAYAIRSIGGADRGHALVGHVFEAPKVLRAPESLVSSCTCSLLFKRDTHLAAQQADLVRDRQFGQLLLDIEAGEFLYDSGHRGEWRVGV
jgi:hypothetical protein